MPTKHVRGNNIPRNATLRLEISRGG